MRLTAKYPDWASNDTLIDTINHHIAEVWLEEHENPETKEHVYLVKDTGGCNDAICGTYSSFEDASNAIGDNYGYDEFWKKF